jgi:hypothetical protein
MIPEVWRTCVGRSISVLFLPFGQLVWQVAHAFEHRDLPATKVSKFYSYSVVYHVIHQRLLKHLEVRQEAGEGRVLH